MSLWLKALKFVVRRVANHNPELAKLVQKAEPKIGIIQPRKETSMWLRFAALSGASAVGAGAYGAHSFKPRDAYFTGVYERANQYHLLHTLLLGMAPLAKRPNIVGIAALSGILGFSGSCYYVAVKEDRSVGKLAPYGGYALILAWLSLAL